MNARGPTTRINKEEESELKDRIRELQDRLRERSNEIKKRNKTIEDLEKRNKELEDIASTDPLTGVYNRRGWSEHVGVMIDLLAEKGMNESVRIAMIDIDNFKGFNDKFGHAKGDEVLKGIARIISGSVRDYDVVGRFGGEEFVVALFGAGTEGIYSKAEAIREAIEKEQFVHEGERLSVTVSIGVGTVFEWSHEDKDPAASESIRAADAAMYAAKKAGRNRVSIHPDDV